VTWAFTFADQPWFNGLRELTTNQVALPVFNAFKLFAKLAPRRLEVDCPSMLPVDDILAHGVLAKSDIGAVATRDERRVTVLLWNYHDVAGLINEPAEVMLQLNGLVVDRERIRAVRQFTVDEKSGNSYTKWRELGSPSAPSPEQVRLLTAAAELAPQSREWQSVASGSAELAVTLSPQSVVLIEFTLGSD